MRRVNKKNLYIIISILITTLALVAIAVVLIVRHRDRQDEIHLKMNSLAVNDVIADPTEGDDFKVHIPQCETVSLACTYGADIECKWYDATDREIADISKIPIGGKDVKLKYVLSKSKAGDTIGTLSVINDLPESEGLFFIITNADQIIQGNEITIELPPKTNGIENADIALSDFFSYKLYSDAEKTDELDSASELEISSVYYLDIYNVNKEEVYKSYVVRIVVQRSSVAELSAVTVNGIAATNDQGGYSISVAKTSYLNIDAVPEDDSAQVEIISGDVVIDDPTNVFIAETVGEHKFTIRVTAENGDVRNYELTVALIYDSTDTLDIVYVNATACYGDHGEYSVLLKRSDNISIDIRPTSVLSKVKVYSDRDMKNEVSNLTNVDTSDSGLDLTYYILVTAENGNGKQYSLNIRFAPSDACVLSNISVNGSPTVFTDNGATVDILGKDRLFVRLSDIYVSKYATYKVYHDETLNSEVSNVGAAEITPDGNCIYIEVVAEDGEHTAVYRIEFNIISDDNSLKRMTVNNTVYDVMSENETIYLESCKTISIAEIEYDINATANVYYDAMQTAPVPDLADIEYADKRADLYIRVVAESSDIRVYHIAFIIKDAPEIEFKTSTVVLSDWQESIDTADLFDAIDNSYPKDQYRSVVSWNGVLQPTEHINVENAHKIYTLQIDIESPYFETLTYSKQIEIVPYTLTPVSAEVIAETIEITEQTETASMSDLLNVDGGSYILGKHYYIAIYKDASTLVVTSIDRQIDLTVGTYNIRICSIGDLFAAFSVAPITVVQKELDPPSIKCESYYEYAPNPDATLLLRDLFSVYGNGNKILRTATYIDGKEGSELVLTDGLYEIKVIVVYDKGTIEKTFAVFVGELSDNADAEIYINGAKAEFDNARCEVELAYSEELYMLATPVSNKANAQLTVNGVPAQFGIIDIADGNNQLQITITAENGDIKQYVITVNRLARVLPEINTADKTVRLAEDQTYVLLADCYSVRANDYAVETVALFYGETQINGDILPVPNEDRYYEITVRISGDFGIIDKTFGIGVLRYSDVKINFKSQNISNSDGYVYSAADFIDSVEFIGYDAPYYYDVYINGEIFTYRTLQDGVYVISVKALHNGIVVKEGSAVFTVGSIRQEQTVSVEQIKTSIGIDGYNKTLDFADIFVLDQGEYALSELDVYYLIDGSQSYELNMTVGQNTFDVIVVRAGTQEELFAKTFYVDCEYRPTAQNIFATLSINGVRVQINGNTVALVSSEHPTDIVLTYTLAPEFTVSDLAEKHAVQPGANYIDFTAIRDGQKIPCVLEIYDLSSLADYINTVRYGAFIAENNIIADTTGSQFDVTLFSVDLSDNHIKTEIAYDRIEPNVYDVTVSGKYSGIDIGRIVVRVFIGAEKPILRNVVSSVSADSIVSYSINEFSVDLICVSDDTSVTPQFRMIYDKYGIECNTADLHIGLNKTEFTVIDGDTLNRFVYTLNITLFPVNIVTSVEYSGTRLDRKDNVFIADVDAITQENIRYESDARIDLPLTYKSAQTLYNGAVVGYDYTVLYEYIEIYRFSVAASNNNTAVSVVCDRTELVQYGNDRFVLSLNIDKTFQGGELIKQFSIRSIYPYTKITGDGVVSAQNGYTVTVDLGNIKELELGSANRQVYFCAVSLGGSFDYTIDITVNVSETDESTVPLVITVNGRDKLYFSDADVESAFIISAQTLHADIFERELILTVSGSAAYKFYENNVEKTSIAIVPTFDGYLKFDVISAYGTQHVVIPYEYIDSDGNAIETGIMIDGNEFLILENAEFAEVSYGGKVYNDVAVANKKLTLPCGTTEVNAEFFGYFADDDTFIFSDGSVGNIGTLSIQGDRLVILMDDYGTVVPYAIIEIEFSEEIL